MGYLLPLILLSIDLALNIAFKVHVEKEAPHVLLEGANFVVFSLE
jgi:hypothetical protein